MPNINQLSLGHSPDIFTIICCNDSFQLALDHNTIKILLRVCKRARPLLSSKVVRFHTWCQKAGLCHPDGQMRIGLTPSETIALSLHCENQYTGSQSWLVALADQGNASASYIMAKILQLDLDQDQVKWSEKEATKQQIFHHLENAAEAQHPMAQFHLAKGYHDGNGFNQSPAKAVELYLSLAERGIPQAQISLGQSYENGEGVDQDFNAAIEWYSKAADQSSEDGRLHIVFLRGWFSFIGHGVEQSDVDAFNRWQEVSTQSTDPVIKPIATHMVGWMHYLGRGTVQDNQKGAKIIRENKSDEFPLGEDECLASIWNDTKSDSAAARKFFELCKLGSDRDWLCRHLMAVCLFHGFGTTKDDAKATCIFEQLAKDDHSDSQLWIGMCCYWGLGVSQDNEMAFEWFSKSANQGNSYGQWMVGHCYYHGSAVTKNLTKAIEWYDKSAEQGNRYGQCCLGLCYETGWGVPEGIDIAIFWYRKSADQGLVAAIDNLKDLGKWP
ncbi:uncharacterized protein BJ171DRAFT_605255 [Polychytrium aggregatum]|uniref:uncharacterized protein n=1 Tax=Polychytrium aggregatum TaxID=110093 RepID=UPI0022FF3C02|nr:uncharacterized protein BJ171DRAFT_605255 [Polychytrium aggregatum]KAI9193061.1 hypothetical protein BJ171DRAFT_605255 [Polychytrium aggregatum]